jgi:DNA polymerase III epsilon subunit-like protein
MYLFFDTETTGLPKVRQAPLRQLDNWPRLVQLAWLAYGMDGHLLQRGEVIIKPAGFTIPEAATKIHGITTALAAREGRDIEEVLQEFQKLAASATILVGHHLWFDLMVVSAEFLRKELPNALQGKKEICTMLASTAFCGIPGPYGCKWPRLADLYMKLFGRGFENAHSAGADIAATAECFWELKRRGVITV